METDEDVEVNWLESISAIETEKGIVYFCNKESCPSLEKLRAVDTRRKSLLIDTSERFPIGDFVSQFEPGTFMYSITAFNPFNMIQDIVRNKFLNELLRADLCEAFPDQRILTGLTFFPHISDYFERSYTLVLPLDYPKNHRKIVHDLAVKYEQAAYFVCRITPDGECEQTIVHLEGKAKEVEESLVVIERPIYHPAFYHRRNNGVFHALRTVMDTLSKCDYLSEANELINIALQHAVPDGKTGGEENDERDSRYPVLAIEGSGVHAGLSEQCSHIGQLLGAKHIRSPPSCIRHLRATFDSQNDLIRGAFYAVANYIIASQADLERAHRPVILDRFWNSTAAFAITSEVGGRGASSLPPKEHFVYEWPEDLLKPDATILLGSKKGAPAGQAPQNLATKDDRLKEQLMYKSLCRMKTSSWIEVDHVKDRCRSKDAVTMVTIDKLEALKIGCFHVGKHAGEMCPSSHMAPSAPDI